MLRSNLSSKKFLSEITNWTSNGHLNIINQSNLLLEHYVMLASFINTEKTISKITIRESSLNSDCLQTLVPSLINHPALLELNIEAPKRMGRTGLGTIFIGQLIRTNRVIQKLTLSECKMGPQDGKILANALGKNRTITRLDISMNHIGSDAAAQMLEALNVNQTLTHLNLWRTGINDDIKRLAIALGQNHSLTNLILNRNTITDQGCIILANYLKQNTTLKYLNLDNPVQKPPVLGNQALEKVFRKNHWMDKMVLIGSCLNRTEKERALQIEREFPIKDPTGCELALSVLKDMRVHKECYALLTNYINDFDEVSENYVLSYVDFYKLFKAISQDPSRDRLNFLFRENIVTKLFFKMNLYEVYLGLDKYALIDENNFKSLYLLPPSQRKILRDFLTDTDQAAIVSDIYGSIFNELLSKSKALLASLINYLIENIVLLKKDLFILFSLSATNIERLHDAVTDLLETENLNNGSYQIALSRICIKIKKPMESIAEKISRKEHPIAMKRSQITINQSITLFTQHSPDKKYSIGGYGKVKEGYTKEDTETPLWNVKKLLRKQYGEVYAKRAATYNHLLGRESYYYKRNNLYTIVSTWQSGKSLNKYSLDELNNIAISKRFCAIVSGLLDIEKFHTQYQIHGDIKSNNIIYDSIKNKISVIDFDSARKKGTHNPRAPVTEELLDKNKFKHHKQSFSDDVYAFGLSLMELFPELYEDDDCIKDEREMVPIEYAVVLLISAMINEDRYERCTNLNAIHFCKQIVSNIDGLTVEWVNDIADDTILQAEITVEDALRGRLL